VPAPRASAGLRACRAARPLRFALPLALLAVVAAGCGASLGGRYDTPTTAPSELPSTGETASTLRVVTAQPLPSLDPAFATTRQARAIANALCTPLVTYADAEGLPGTVIVPGLARDLPIASRNNTSFSLQLLAGLHFADGKPLTGADVEATFERLLDPATGSPGAALFSEIAGTSKFAMGEEKHLSGVRVTGGQITFRLKRPDPAFLARLAMPIACPVESGTPHRQVPGLLARAATGRYRVVSRTPSHIELARATDATAVPDGDAPGASAHIEISRLSGTAALTAAIRSGTADLSLDDLPGASAPDLVVPSDELAVLRINPSSWPLSDPRVRSALSLALDREALAAADGGDVRPAGSLLLDPGAPGALPPDSAAARALLRSEGAEGAVRFALWAEAGAQARIARSIADQLAAVGVHVDLRIAGTSERPIDAQAWIEWLNPAFGDPAAVFVPLAEALAQPSQAAIAARVRGADLLVGDSRRAAFRRLDQRLGGSALGAIPLLRANFSTPVSSMLVGEGTHPVFDIDLAQLSTRS
jgi:ABC-type transport system substrate-binding protein